MGKVILIITFLFSIFNNNIIDTINSYCKDKKGQIYKEIIYVSIKNQKLYYISSNSIEKEYPISSARKGIGNKKNSDKTPLGLHFIKEKHGSETPENGRMIGRVFYGQIAEIFKDTSSSKSDDITSRILWLSGDEKGINQGGDVDSYQRYIYIHGTSEEGKIGTPASHGCIRMKNTDVIELYSLIKLNTKVLILDN